ncbi:5-oxoprolinase [Geodia barretti]|nr:5-oxoprolinase [Geodia barretti]
MSTQVFKLGDLTFGHSLDGPAVLVDESSTILVEPGCTARITQYGDVEIMVGQDIKRDLGPELDTIRLSVFSHRFMSIAEQMGRVLHWRDERPVQERLMEHRRTAVAGNKQNPLGST